jgi:hypothetical protein
MSNYISYSSTELKFLTYLFEKLSVFFLVEVCLDPLSNEVVDFYICFLAIEEFKEVVEFKSIEC